MVSPDASIKVNLGCGPSGLPGWINVDWGILPLLSKFKKIRSFLVGCGLLLVSYSQEWPVNLKLHDCRKKLPFEDSSVDFIYTSHFLEHLYRYDALKLLKECRRTLCPGGVLRIGVPDTRIMAEKYIAGDIDFFRAADPSNPPEVSQVIDLFLQNLYGFDTWSEPTLLDKLRRLFIRGHLWMYDYSSLENILREAGFSEIRRCEPGQGKVPDIEKLDIHRLGSLYVESSYR